MINDKIYLLGIAILILLMGLLLTHFDGSHPVTKNVEWVLKQLPEVKTVEYLESLKKD